MTEFRDRSLSVLVDFLRGTYPVTARILGELGFDAAALAFALRHAPAYTVPIAHGDFAEFLAEQLPIADALHIADVAALERLWSEALVAADAPALDFGEPPDNNRAVWTTHQLSLHPATGFIWVRTPAVTVWQAHRNGLDMIAPESRAEGGLITRRDGRVALRSISRPEHRMLSGLSLGEAVAQAAEATVALYPEADIAAVFAKLASCGAFAKPPDMERL